MPTLAGSFYKRHAVIPPRGLQLLVGTRFQVLFHSAPAVLFTFPSRYLFTIGRQVVFSLRRWSSQIQTGFLVSRPTRGHHQQKLRFRRRGSHPLWPAFPCRWSSVTFSDCCARRLSRLSCPSTPCLQRQPAITQPRFRLFPFRSPLLGESLLFSLPRGTEMFQFPRCPP